MDDALAAAEAGAGLLGFVLVETSPRYTSPERAGEIVAALRARGVALPCVGVVATAPVEHLRQLRRQCGFDLLQVCGEDAEQAAQALGPRAILAWQVRDEAQFRLPCDLNVFACLLDAQGLERRAGNSRPWDWRRMLAWHLGRRIIVAGGLRPENVGEAVRMTRPWAVDVASGVEMRPGRKDHQAMVRFVRAVQEADHELRGGQRPPLSG
jgi:phosphoribosylanthranilate isomerase